MNGKYRNGQIKMEDHDGFRSYYYENGVLKAIGHFDGKMQGEWRFYRKSGKLWQVGHLMDDNKHGPWLRYDHNGKIEKETYFINGKAQKDKGE